VRRTDPVTDRNAGADVRTGRITGRVDRRLTGGDTVAGAVADVQAFG